MLRIASALVAGVVCVAVYLQNPGQAPQSHVQEISRENEKQSDTAPPNFQMPKSAGGSESPYYKEMLQIKKRFFAGDYGATARFIEGELARKDTDSAYRDWLEEQYPVVLTSLGWLEIKLARCDKALATFRKSLEFANLIETVKGMAFCHHKNKNFNSSFEYFSRYLEQKPEDDAMRLLFTDVLESRGNFELAAETLAQLAKKKPEDRDIEKRVKSMRARTKEGVGQGVVTTSHFLFRYRFGTHDELVQYFTVELERVLDVFIDRFGFRAPRRIIEITFYPSDNFSELVAHSPEWARGIFDGRIRIPVSSDRNQLARTLRHELVHALLFEMVDGRAIPTWFNEGLAQRLECDECGFTEFPKISGGFLEEKTLSDSFLGFSAAKAKVAYLQSVYLIANLENSMNVDDALYRTISRLTAYTRLDSDSLLSPVDKTFSELVQVSEKNWSQKRTFHW